ATHKKLCDFFRWIFFGFKCLRYFGETRSDFAGDFGGSTGRIERLRVEPDSVETFADLRLTQLFKIDAETLPIGKLRVIFPLASEISIDFNAVADITNEDEGWPAV